VAIPIAETEMVFRLIAASDETMLPGPGVCASRRLHRGPSSNWSS
jgi:hypothetical protein